MNTLVNKFPKFLNPEAIDLARLNRVLPPIISLLLIIASSYTLSQITWALIPAAATRPAPPVLSSRPAATARPQSYQQISDAHLFGKFSLSSVQPTQKTEAPETRLNLVLKGVLSTQPMEYSSAIISLGKNGKEDIYAVGDRVSSATVREIYADRVILERGGQLETLRMPKDTSGNLIQQSSTQQNTAASAPRADTPGAVLSNIRKQILKSPTSFAKYAIPIPYNENGKLRGYRLQPQGDRTLFDAVGLQANDVIISLNGVALNNPARGIKALQKLQNAKSVDIVVLRNGAEMPLHFELP